MIVLKGGVVFGPDRLTRADLVIAGDVIADVGHSEWVEGARIIDATNSIIGPGFVDLHVHFRDPGQTWKEDLESGSRAAIAGGFTAVVMMPNTEPAIDTPEAAAEVVEQANQLDLLTVSAAGALTRGRKGLEPSDLQGLYDAGFRMFTDDGDSVADADLLEQIMDVISGLPGAFVSEHAEDVSMTSDGHMHDGEVSARHGLGGLPAQAEEVIVERDIELSNRTGCRLHLQHLSSAGSIELVRKAKSAGSNVTAEVTPHHLALDDTDLHVLDPNLKMYPPLRTPRDRAALVKALSDGVIDAVATDHAPHTRNEKDVPFEEAPRGLIGLETAAPVTFEALSKDIDALFERMSVAPARIGGFERHGRAVQPGEPANLVVWSPDTRWVPTTFRSKSTNSPFLGKELTGRVMATIHEGALVYEGEGINV